jgi:hypothetical protein
VFNLARHDAVCQFDVRGCEFLGDCSLIRGDRVFEPDVIGFQRVYRRRIPGGLIPSATAEVGDHSE